VAAGKNIDSLSEICRLLQKGEQFVLAAPSPEPAAALRSALAVALDPEIFACDAASTKTVAAALAAIRKAVPAKSRRKFLLVDLSSSLHPWIGKPAELARFCRDVRSSRKGFRVLWILKDSSLDGDLLLWAKDSARFFAQIRFGGGSFSCQFLTARGVFSPDFFLPRPIDLADPHLALGPAMFLSATKDAGGSVVDLFQEPYREMFREAHEGIVLFRLEGGDVTPNPRACEMLGHDPDSLRTLPLKVLVDPRDYRSALRMLSALSGRRKVKGEINLRRKSGRVVAASVTASVLRGDRAMVVLRDVSDERRQAKELGQEQARMRALADGSTVAQAVLVGKKLVYANPRFRLLFPWMPRAGDGATLRDLLGKQRGDLLGQLTGGDADASGKELDILTPEQKHVEVLVSSSSTVWEGKDAWFMSFVDVTSRNDAIRAMRESEATYRGIVERQAGAVAIVQDGRLALVNPGFASLFGYPTATQLVDTEAAKLVVPRGRAEFLEKVSGIANAKEGNSSPLSFEFTGKKRDGSSCVIEARGVALSFGGRRGALCHCTDVSGQRKVQEEIKRQSREHGIVESLAHDLHVSLEPKEVMAAGLRGAMRWLGLEQGGCYRLEPGSSMLSLERNESLPEQVLSALSSLPAQEGIAGLAVKTAEAQLLEMESYPPYLPHRSLFESCGIRTVLLLPLVAGETVHGMLLLCSMREAGSAARDPVLLAAIARHTGDALTNAFAFDLLRGSEIRYRTTVGSIPDVIYETGPTGTITFISPQVEQAFGYRADDFLRNPDLWRTIIHPDDRGEYARRVAGPGEDALTYRILPKGKAAYRRVRDAFHYLRDAGGMLKAIVGSVGDVTELMERNGEAAKDGAGVLQSIPEGILLFDRDFRLMEWNHAMELITGIPRAEVVGKNAFEGRFSLEFSDLHDLLNRALAGDPVSSEEVRYTRSETGEALVLWCRLAPLRREDGTIGGVAGTVTDVTSRKGLERELRESEETLRNVIDTMGDALMISDLQGKVWEVNREFTALTGYPRSEVIGKTFPYPWLLESEMFRLVAWLAALREQKFLRDFDMTWKRRNGREVAISLNTTLLRNALGEPVAMLNLARDISERKRLSNELGGKSRQIEMLNRIISEANSTEKFSRIFDVIAAEVRALAAYNCMNVLLLTEDNAHLIVHAAVGEGEKYPVRGAIMPLEDTVSRLVVAERQALVVEDVRTHVGLGKGARAASDGLLSQVSVPIMLNDRAIGTLNVCSTVPDAFSVEALSYLQPIADQIGALIERTQLFEQVNDDRSHIRTLLDSMESVVYTVDQAGAVEEVNTAWREFAVVQGTPELRDETSVLGKSVEQIIADPSLRSEITAVMPRLFEGSLRDFSREFEVSGKEETRSFQLAVAPMTSNDRVNGLVFTYTDITDSKRTEAEIKRRNAELLALNAVASAINKSLDMKSIFTVVRDELSWSLSFESFLYFTVDHARGDLRITEQAIGGVDHALPVPPAEQEIVAAAKGTLSSGTMADGRALIAVPVRSKGVVVAVFALTGHDPEASDHLRLLGSIGNLVEIAVDRALLYEDTVKKSEEIQERNKELDDFTYVVSHDLKEPLITIEGYSKIIQAEYRESVDEEGQAYLTSVVQASQRMKNLIDDLLTLSRIGRVSETQESLPLREVIDEILRDFAFSLKERHATVSVPAVLPSVRYNRTQLGMVFRNLIANAIKFNTTPEPRIDISVTETGDEYTIAVRDNGIGIERQHFEKVFVIFQRLHRSDEFRGTGAGLTIVKKIVENHHGRIWLDSVVGQGTTFFFTIPVKSDG